MWRAILSILRLALLAMSNTRLTMASRLYSDLSAAPNAFSRCKSRMRMLGIVPLAWALPGSPTLPLPCEVVFSARDLLLTGACARVLATMSFPPGGLYVPP